MERPWYFVRRWPVIPAVILFALIVGASFAPILAPYNPIYPDFQAVGTPPFFQHGGSLTHPLGTDNIGRDIYSRLLYGARVSLAIVSAATVSSIVVGTALGIIAAYAGGVVDEVIMRIVDIWHAVPFILVALVLVIVFGKSDVMMVILLFLLAWAGAVRNIRAEALTLKELDYVANARVAGAGPIRIMIRHIFPGVVSTVIVVTTLRVGGLILAAATLSFLGAGIPPPQPSWGVMVSDGRDFLTRGWWWISTIPGLAIFLVVMAFNFLGDWIRDRLDPRLRQLD